MPFPIRPVSLKDYVWVQSRQGAAVQKAGSVYWRRVRPFLYRPLLTFEPIVPAEARNPRAWPVAYQYATRSAAEANSHLNFLVYDELRGYALDTVSHNRRRLIKAAAKHFTIRPITDVKELQDQGHRVYLSFYDRTRYEFKSDRTRPEQFRDWAADICASPASFVLGAYGAQGLAAVSVSFWVDGTQTLLYSTLFAETEAQSKGVCELMLHELRLSAAQEPGIDCILLRPYQGGTSHDQYYLLRGAALRRQPARLRINRGLDRLLKWLVPAQHARLYGLVEVSDPTSAAGEISPQNSGSQSGTAANAAATQSSSSNPLT